jgi:RecJ-like exonuclease
MNLPQPEESYFCIEPNCPDCKGTGQVTLLITVKECGRCGGCGNVPHETDLAKQEEETILWACEVGTSKELKFREGDGHNTICDAAKSVTGTREPSRTTTGALLLS